MTHRPRLDCPCCVDAARSPAFRRREVIRASFAGLACAAMASPALAQAAAPSGPPRVLRIQRAYAETDDQFEGVYWENGRYVRTALQKLDYVLRDLPTEEVTPMDPRLFDVLHAVAQQMDSDEPFQVISGYRAPERNANLARQSRRVSTASLHMSGMAADVRLPDRDSYAMARLAAEMQMGGVGLYRRDGFVHLDCGQPRRWG
ncbi:YcbK family protein [Roseomonas gilardii]|uniref:YcbK family protein n=1 Tax=Roseomonas gilardii TaxID=257708 RepID=UPI000486D9DC|nr:DUF882 domain-containing protein [Roseomonas gilardii]SUE43936.1 Bacterial protein of uncharacterised function (DUF882) [Roseomonas gilardii subsp. rosea]